MTMHQISTTVNGRRTERAVEARRRLADFIHGPYETGLRPDELLLRVEVPVDVADVAVYRKMTITERPIVGVAVVRLRADRSWRVVVGAVGEQVLVVELDDLRSVDAAGIAGALDVTPDHSGSESYKRHVTEVTVRRSCEQARLQSEGDAA